MLFVELRFLAFFAAVMVLHWALRSAVARKVVLLLASYAFYAVWDERFLALIIFSTLVDWICGARIHAARGANPSTERSAQRAWLGLSLVCNLGLLATFKYYGFFIDSAQAALEALGVGASLPTLNLILPVGISFYTFQTLSYSLDIYFGRLKPARTMLDLALFVGFFPQLVAGPIVKAKEFLPQLEETPRWRDVDARAALVLFFVGFIKKSCLSDALAPAVDAVHSAPGSATLVEAWTAALAFAAQIYCDFSGYTDMAIGCAALLGYRLPKNFAAPYLTRSMGAFWTHWHITLGSWFREYLYLPLGGNRRGLTRTLRNVFIVFVVSGLWHGAAWTFVVWGALHGLFAAWERTSSGRIVSRFPAVIGVLYINLVWTLSMVFFRADSMSTAGVLLRTMFTGGPGGPTGEEPPLPAGMGTWVLPTLAGAFFVHFVWQKADLERRWSKLPPEVFGASLGAAVALALPWISTHPAPYIYFTF